MPLSEPAKAITIYVDADACPVKAETYRVAERYGIKVYLVSNSHIAVPREPFIERIVVDSGLNAADDWIAERASRGSIVVTADIPLAHRCVLSRSGIWLCSSYASRLDRQECGPSQRGQRNPEQHRFC